MNVNVQQLVGPLCMTYQDGEKLHAAYRPAFDRGETIFLDFSGTRIFVSQFFNAAVGQLLKEHSIEEVRSRLKFQNLPAAANAPFAARWRTRNATTTTTNIVRRLIACWPT